MIDEQRIIAEITNDYDVMIELALKGYISLGFELKRMEKFVDYFENLPTQAKLTFNGSKVNITDGFYCPDDKCSYSYYQLMEKINIMDVKDFIEKNLSEDYLWISLSACGFTKDVLVNQHHHIVGFAPAKNTVNDYSIELFKKEWNKPFNEENHGTLLDIFGFYDLGVDNNG